MIGRSKTFLQGRQPGAPDVGSVQHDTFMNYLPDRKLFSKSDVLPEEKAEQAFDASDSTSHWQSAEQIAISR